MRPKPIHDDSPDPWDRLLHPRVALQLRADLVSVVRTVPLNCLGIDEVASPDDVSNFLADAEGYLAGLDPQATEALENFKKVLDFVNHQTVIRKTNALDFFETP